MLLGGQSPPDKRAVTGKCRTASTGTFTGKRDEYERRRRRRGSTPSVGTVHVYDEVRRRYEFWPRVGAEPHDPRPEPYINRELQTPITAASNLVSFKIVDYP
jgi:hypothetical protein